MEAKFKVRVKTRLKKFDGEITPGKEPTEVRESEEREVNFDDLPHDMQQEVLKRWE